MSSELAHKDRLVALYKAQAEDREQKLARLDNTVNALTQERAQQQRAHEATVAQLRQFRT